MLSCDHGECSRRRSAPPIAVQWELMTQADPEPGSALQIVIDICHAASDASPTWCSDTEHEVTTSVSARVRCVVLYV